MLFNVLFRNLHEFARASFIDEIVAMTSEGGGVPESLLLAAAVTLQIPIVMIFLSQTLRETFSRRASMIAAPTTIAMVIVNNLAPDLDDAFFSGVECVTLLAIMAYEWRWPAAGLQVAPRDLAGRARAPASFPAPLL